MQDIIERVSKAVSEELAHIEFAETRLLRPESVDIAHLDAVSVARLIDHTLLKPDATSAQVQQLCADALEHQFASVCVNSTWLALCQSLLGGSAVKCCVVTGFPMGAMLGAAKAYETALAVEQGAQEVDTVINVGRLKDKDYAVVYADLAGVAHAAHAGGALAKVILETGLLTQEEKIAGCLICKWAGIDFVKTATGFQGGGATVEDVALMRQVVGPEMGVKAAGGIRTAADARNMIAAGATRIGASAGISIVQGFLGTASAIAANEVATDKGAY
ncbi:MAG: deoxyribose-phosphate aldolase [Caldilineaceae bacterium]